MAVSRPDRGELGTHPSPPPLCRSLRPEISARRAGPTGGALASRRAIGSARWQVFSLTALRPARATRRQNQAGRPGARGRPVVLVRRRSCEGRDFYTHTQRVHVLRPLRLAQYGEARRPALARRASSIAGASSRQFTTPTARARPLQLARRRGAPEARLTASAPPRPESPPPADVCWVTSPSDSKPTRAGDVRRCATDRT